MVVEVVDASRMVKLLLDIDGKRRVAIRGGVRLYNSVMVVAPVVVL